MEKLFRCEKCKAVFNDQKECAKHEKECKHDDDDLATRLSSIEELLRLMENRLSILEATKHSPFPNYPTYPTYPACPSYPINPFDPVTYGDKKILYMASGTSQETDKDGSDK